MRKGFTLIEMVIVVIVFLIIVAVSVPLYFKFQEFSERESVKQEVIVALREIQFLAQIGQNNKNHGVYFSGHTYTSYMGSSYAELTPGSDTTYTLSNVISALTNTDINFTKNTGSPITAGTLTLVNDRSGQQSVINYSLIGLIE